MQKLEQLKTEPDEIMIQAINSQFKMDPSALLKDPKVLIGNALWIINKASYRQLLIPNKAQMILLDAIRYLQDKGLPIRIIILKARQEGISTMIAGWIYAHVLCRSNVPAGVIANEKGNADLLFEIYRRFYRFSEEALQKEQRYNALGRTMTFEDESRIDVMLAKDVKSDTAGRSGRSRTYNYLHRSEIAFWSNPQATANALNQTVPVLEDTAIFDESTANGYGDYFWSEWERANEGKSGYLPIFLPWHIHAEYKMAFRSDRKKRELENTIGTSQEDEFGDERRLIEKYGITLEQLNWRRYIMAEKCGGNLFTFMREYPAEPDEAFQTTGQNVFNTGPLQFYIDKAVTPKIVGDLKEERGGVEFIDSPRGLLRIWEPPEPMSEYIVGSDHAEGLDSGDWNVAIVVRRLPLRVVARLQGYDGRRIPIDEFADLMYLLGKFYNDAYLCPENNNDGGTAVKIIERRGYLHLMSEKQMEISTRDRFGWRNSEVTRRRIVNLLIEHIDGELIDILDEELLREAQSFVRINGRAQAIKKGERRGAGEPRTGYFDDILFALGGALLANLYLSPARPQKEIEADEEWERRLEEYERSQNTGSYLDYV